MAIIWEAPMRRHEAGETQVEIAWRLFLVQTLTGLTEDPEAQARAAARRRGPLAPALDEDKRAA